ncbi:outer membrane porin, OprD family [Providencia rustigianii]|uniref:Outer membrane porin, OprD family n=1 Tax=Providencia rustigianii DSM 4541 TaxID=500637 RepID=D1P591_9GAMM|nr:OprD family outer membrane porin [Providencia rustigianii]EFB71452.1 outer membrane porin, OprD family [Providencia rustigianii DSM 4541]SUC27366.1 outer membrane porin, OprD family [Providencia rustigianii]VEB70484.1 outer membrane porin, OprD family [Providencia rustigianii]
MKVKNIALILLPSCLFTFGAHANNWENIFKENSFVADSELELSTRNMWKYLKSENRFDANEQRYRKQVAQAWGQNIQLDYQSGYFADFIGFDASYYGAIKLAASKDFASRAILYNDDGEAKGYNKIGQRYAKFKFDFEPVNVKGKAGWFTLKNTGIFTNSQRLSLNAYNGYYTNTALSDWNLDLLYLDGKVMRRDSPNIDRMYFRDGNGVTHDINHVVTGGINYDTKPLKVAYFIGQADDVFRQQGLEVKYKLNSDITLSSQIYGHEYGSDGKRTSNSTKRGKQNFDKRAWHYAGEVQWKVPETPWTLTTGLTHTTAHKTNGVGQFARNPIGNTRGRFNSPAYADIDYVRDGETMLELKAEYKVNSALSVGANSNYSEFSYSGERLRQGQVGLFSYWKPTENLSVSLSGGMGWHHQQESDNSTPKLYDGESRRAHSLSGSMTTTYRFKM